MIDPFELVSTGDVKGLAAALAAAPALAAARSDAGTSLFAWAYYAGKPEAAPVIRPHLSALDPSDAIIADEIDRVRAALAEGWDANTRAPDGFTPLALAAFFVRPAIFELLLPLTQDLDARAENGQRVAAIHAATAMRRADMVERLLRAGATADLEQADGFTPLHAAAQHGDLPTAAMLVLFGADPRRTNARGQNAIDHARAAGHEWLALRLSSHG